MFGATIGANPIAYSLIQSIGLSGDLIFNGYNLSSCGDLGRDTSNYDDINSVDLDTYNAPRTDGGGVLGYYIRGKTLSFRLVSIKNTVEEIEELIDEMKLKLFKQEGLLKIKVGGKYRVVKASLTSLNFNRDFTIKALANIDISFKTMENFRDESITSGTESSVSSSSLSLDITNDGVRNDYLLYFIFGSGISGTDEITIEQDGYILSINHNITDGSILVVDGMNKQVLYNDTPIDYDGPFVQLENGSNPIQISINGTYTADITYLYYKNYL